MKKQHHKWWVYIGIVIILDIVGIAPTIQLAKMAFVRNMQSVIKNYILVYLIYLISIAVGCFIIVMIYRYISFLRPINKMAQAMGQVVDGDFSVKLTTTSRWSRSDMNKMVTNFNQMVAELASIETLKDDFVVDVSHEFKTPLAVLQNYIEALQTKNLNSEEQQQYLTVIAESATMLTDLVSNVLRLNRLETQQSQLQSISYNLTRQISDCILQHEPILVEKKLTVELALEEHVMVDADENLLMMVWNNLLDNAIKFTGVGGKISIVLSSTPEIIVVKFQDNGSGMSSVTLDHLFDKFYQANQNNMMEGNGLGLTLVQKALDISNGRIEVDSELGIGTVMSISIWRQ